MRVPLCCRPCNGVMARPIRSCPAQPGRSIRRGRLPSLAGMYPLIWMTQVHSLVVDLWDMSRDVQEIAFRKGLIPYIPTDQKTDCECKGR